MTIYGLKSPNSKIQIYHSKYKTFAINTITLDDVFQHYFKKLFVEDVICEPCSSIKYETRRTTFTMIGNLIEPTSVLNILYQREISDDEEHRVKKNQIKVAIP